MVKVKVTVSKGKLKVRSQGHPDAEYNVDTRLTDEMNMRFATTVYAVQVLRLGARVWTFEPTATGAIMTTGK